MAQQAPAEEVPSVSAYVEDHEGEAIDFSKILTRSIGLMP